MSDRCEVTDVFFSGSLLEINIKILDEDEVVKRLEVREKSSVGKKDIKIAQDN